MLPSIIRICIISVIAVGTGLTRPDAEFFLPFKPDTYRAWERRFGLPELLPDMLMIELLYEPAGEKIYRGLMATKVLSDLGALDMVPYILLDTYVSPKGGRIDAVSFGMTFAMIAPRVRALWDELSSIARDEHMYTSLAQGEISLPDLARKVGEHAYLARLDWYEKLFAPICDPNDQ